MKKYTIAVIFIIVFISMALIFDTFDETLDAYVGDVAVFTGGGAGAWDEHIREKVWIIEDGGIFRMWYSGYDATGQGTSKIGYATSTDGITWTRYPGNPIISRPSQDQDPSVVKVSPTSYYMFVERDDNYIDLFTSIDGISWAPYVNNPVKAAATSPVVWKEGTTWYMLYEEMGPPLFSINLATSTDGRTWIDSPHNPVLAEAEHTVPNSIVKIDGVYHLFYHRNVDTWSAWHAVSTDLITWSNRTKIFSDYTSPFTFITSDGRIKSYIWYLDGSRNVYLHTWNNFNVTFVQIVEKTWKK